MDLINVQHLIDYLVPYKDRPLIIDDDGNTYPVTTNDIRPWSDDTDAPIAIIWPTN